MSERTLKLGKRPHVHDPRDIQFKDIRAGLTLPTPPANFGHGTMFKDGEDLFRDWDMNGNGPDPTVQPGFEGAGDCVFACGAHTTRVTNVLGGHPVEISGKQSIADYSAVTGYVIGDPSTDQGTDMRTALKYRQKTGLLDAAGNRHKIGAFVALTPGDWDEYFQAVYVFSAVEFGFEFQQAQDDQFASGTWDYVPNSPIEGGHAIPGLGRNSNRGGVVSWAKHLWITEAFYRNLVDEAYAIVYEEELKNGKTERGMDLAQLQAALKDLA
jgi:hypothetical protein